MRWPSGWWSSVAAVVPGLLLWEIVGRAGISFFVPPFTSVMMAGLRVWSSDRFLTAVQDSAVSLAVGFALAVILGVGLGLLMGTYRLVEWPLDIYINLLMTAPKPALVPVFILLFGLGRVVIVLTVFLYAFFVIVVNTVAAVRSVPRPMIDMARSFGAGHFRLFRRIVLPSAAPLILAGVRVGAGRAVKGVIIGEQLISIVGLGGLVNRYGTAFQVEELYAMVLFIGSVGLLAVLAIKAFETRTLAWMPALRAHG